MVTDPNRVLRSKSIPVYVTGFMLMWRCAEDKLKWSEQVGRRSSFTVPGYSRDTRRRTEVQPVNSFCAFHLLVCAVVDGWFRTIWISTTLPLDARLLSCWVTIINWEHGKRCSFRLSIRTTSAPAQYSSSGLVIFCVILKSKLWNNQCNRTRPAGLAGNTPGWFWPTSALSELCMPAG